MTRLDYNFIDSNGNLTSLKLMNDQQLFSWLIADGDFLLARISRIDGAWRQIAGQPVPGSLIRGAVEYIEKYLEHSLPFRIKERWPRVILSADKSSDQIVIVCRSHVNIKTFRPIFCRFIPQLLHQHAGILIQVYSFDHTQSFTFQTNSKTLQRGGIAVPLSDY